MLNAVLNSLNEMKEAASKFHSLQNVRRAFCRTVNVKWDEATERFPNFTSVERLLQFASFSFAKDTPQPFLAYCQAALRSEIQAECHDSLYQLKGCKASSLQHDILYIDIQAGKVPFSGAHLFLANIAKVPYLLEYKPRLLFPSWLWRPGIKTRPAFIQDRRL